MRERRDVEGLGAACSQEVSVLPVPQAGAAPRVCALGVSPNLLPRLT